METYGLDEISVKDKEEFWEKVKENIESYRKVIQYLDTLARSKPTNVLEYIVKEYITLNLPYETKMEYGVLDYNLRPLVDNLNKRGYRTLFSCDGHFKDEIYLLIDGLYEVRGAGIEVLYSEFKGTFRTHIRSKILNHENRPDLYLKSLHSIYTVLYDKELKRLSSDEVDIFKEED